jgi:hypothetical protein
MLLTCWLPDANTKGTTDILTPSSVLHLLEVYMQVSAGNSFLCLSLFCVLPTFGQYNCTFSNWQLASGLCHSRQISCLSCNFFSMSRPSAAICSWDKLQIKWSLIYRTFSTKIFNYILDIIGKCSPTQLRQLRCLITITQETTCFGTGPSSGFLSST